MILTVNTDRRAFRRPVIFFEVITKEKYQTVDPVFSLIKKVIVVVTVAVEFNAILNSTVAGLSTVFCVNVTSKGIANLISSAIAALISAISTTLLFKIVLKTPLVRRVCSSFLTLSMYLTLIFIVSTKNCHCVI